MWQPIKTAPKDGSFILLATPKGRIADGFWSSVYGVWSWPYVMVEPTHWMPMPGRPSAEVQPAPSVPPELEPNGMYDGNHHYASGWNDCRAAMLEAQPEGE